MTGGRVSPITGVLFPRCPIMRPASDRRFHLGGRDLLSAPFISIASLNRISTNLLSHRVPMLGTLDLPGSGLLVRRTLGNRGYESRPGVHSLAHQLPKPLVLVSL